MQNPNPIPQHSLDFFSMENPFWARTAGFAVSSPEKLKMHHSWRVTAFPELLAGFHVATLQNWMG